MTPYGYPPQRQPTPPMVGTCLRCHQPIYHGQPFVAFHAGPMHPHCDSATMKRKTAGPLAWLLGTLAVFALLGGLAILSKLTSPDAPSQPRLSAGDHAWIWREDFRRWRPPVCPTEAGWDAYTWARGDNDKGDALRAHDCFTVKPNTEVIVISYDPMRVKVANGTHVSKTGFTGSAWVQTSAMP